jgi:Actin-like ATPase involved in cell division
LLETFKKNFLSIKKIYCGSYTKSFSLKDYFQNYENKFFFDIGYEKSCLIVYNKNQMKLIKFFPLGGNHITKDISKIFKISILDAEKIKKNLGNLDITFLDGIDEKNNFLIADYLNNILDKKIEVDLLKRVVFSRIDEIINFIFKDIDYSFVLENTEKSILVFTGEGSKILNKNSIVLDEKFNFFSEINFFDENSTIVCDSGHKFISMDRPHEINVVPKKIGKYGFFEKIFHFFK